MFPNHKHKLLRGIALSSQLGQDSYLIKEPMFKDIHDLKTCQAKYLGHVINAYEYSPPSGGRNLTA
jgi:hypothetical protein